MADRRSAVAVSLFLLIVTFYLSGCTGNGVSEGEDGTLSRRIGTIIGEDRFTHSTWAILFADLGSGEVIYDHDAEKMVNPASVMKTFTTAYALDILGPNYRFRTPVHLRGELTENGELNGDLILVASGDPTLGGRDGDDGHLEYTTLDHCDANVFNTAVLTEQDPLNGLDRLAGQVSEYGVKRITGDVIIDDRLFPTMRPISGDDYVLSPIMVNDNVIDFIIHPTKANEPAEVGWRPKTGRFSIRSEVKTVALDNDTQIEIVADDSGTITVKGRIRTGDGPVINTLVVDDPPSFARSLLIEALIRKGIDINASVRDDNPSGQLPDGYADLPQVAVLESLPLAENIELILKVSQNMHADILPLLIAVANGSDDFHEGIHRGRSLLMKAGIDSRAVSQSDGQGGVRTDRITPRSAVRLYRFMANQPYYGAYLDGFPVAGIDGTLADVVDDGGRLKGNVQAKTGATLEWDAVNNRLFLVSRALGGYMTTSSGRELAFFVGVNDVPLGDPARMRDDIMNVTERLLGICKEVYNHN